MRIEPNGKSSKSSYAITVVYLEKKTNLSQLLWFASLYHSSSRLFHAVFSDVPPGKMGTLGSISPELLSMMFKRDARYRKSKNESSKSCPK